MIVSDQGLSKDNAARCTRIPQQSSGNNTLRSPLVSRSVTVLTPCHSRLLFGCLISLIGMASADSCRPDDPAIRVNWTALPPLPDSPGVAGPYAGVSNGVLIVAGGANFPDAPPWKHGVKRWHDNILALSDARWYDAGKLPMPSGYGVSVSTSSGIICVGGCDARRHFRDVYELRCTTDQSGVPNVHILEHAPLPIPLAYMCGDVSGDELIIAGGTTEPDAVSASVSVFAMDLSNPGAGWRALPSMPGAGRMLSVAAANHSAFYVFSGVALKADDRGFPSRTYLQDTLRYDRALKQWEHKSPPPVSCAAAVSPAIALPDGRRLIPGGDDGSRAGQAPAPDHPGFPRTSVVYDPVNDRWQDGPPFPLSVVTTTAVPWKQGIVIPSGELRPGVRTSAVSHAEFSDHP